MRPPAPRYKVVERGRRLEVIDTTTGRAVPSPGAGAPLLEGPAGRKRTAPATALPHGGSSKTGPGASASPAGVDDGNVFTTRNWFDDKAPRTVRMNFATRARFDQLRFGAAIVIAFLVAFSFLFWPWFPIAAVALLAQPKLLKKLRGASTRWIDGFDQAA